MRSGGRYVLGIDALPRGTHAAVAVGRTITDTFPVRTHAGEALPLEERVRAAVSEAERLTGARPTEVRVMCIDDGGDGAELEGIADYVRLVVGSRLEVLDLVGDPTIETRPAEVAPGALSLARACRAALWAGR
ncbi:MAG: hypothetical protein AAF467_13350 [Actinomycetota bacterium]